MIQSKIEVRAEKKKRVLLPVRLGIGDELREAAKGGKRMQN